MRTDDDTLAGINRERQQVVAAALAAPVDRERLQQFTRHMAGKLMDAERYGAWTIGATSKDDLRLIVAGLGLLAGLEVEVRPGGCGGTGMSEERR